jgi:integrase
MQGLAAKRLQEYLLGSRNQSSRYTTMKLQLTDRFCQHAKSTTPQTDYFDAAVTGLALRVTSQGVKSWSLLHGTPRRRLTLGRYPALSLAAARTLALETKEGRTQGTVAALAETYLRSISTLRSASEIERRLRKDALPIIGHIPLRELHRRDVTRVIDAKSAPIAARRVFEDLRAMIRWGVSRGDLDFNPIDGMQGPPSSRPRDRVLSDDEIRWLWFELAELNSIRVGLIIKFCLVTAQRLGEVTGLRTDELDLSKAMWNIPGSRTKNGFAHSVPLSQLALSVIKEAQISNMQSAADLEIVDGGVFGVGPNHVGDVIRDQLQGVYHGATRGQTQNGKWTCHDCRRTALTKMAELGVAPIVLGHVANHRTTTKAGITLGVYVQHAYEKEKREALELWSKRLQEIVSD